MKYLHKTTQKGTREAEYICTHCGSQAIGRPGICCGLDRFENCATCKHVHTQNTECECACHKKK